MSIGSIDQSKFYDQDSCSSGAGNDDGPVAFRNAIRSQNPTALVGLNDDPSSSSDSSSSSQPFSLSTFLTQLDDTIKSASSQVQTLLNEMESIVNNDTAATPSDGSTDSADSAAPDPSESSSPADYLATLQNGTETGNPPDNLTLPPGTTAADVANLNGGLLNNLNQLHLQDGTPAGDAAAQKYGYKDMKTLLADKSPEAAAAAGKILWAARACNNLKEADGADRPAKEQSANTLSGITSHHEADNGSTSGAFQNWLKGTSIQSQNVFATNRTHADGEGMSNAEIIGNRIAGVFKKIFSFICPPISDLIQMAQDGAEKVRDDHVGDKDAASHDSAAIKQDGKKFGKDFGEFAANAALMVVPGAGEVGLLAKGAEEAGEAGVKGAEKGAEKAADGCGKDAARSASREADSASEVPSASSITSGLKNLIFGDDFRSKLTDLPKHATRKQKEDYVKQKVQDHLNSLLQQLAPPPNNNSKSAQNSDAADSQAELLALLTEILNVLEGSQASQSSQSGSSSGGHQWKPGDPIGAVTSSPFVRPVALSTSQRPVEATA